MIITDSDHPQEIGAGHYDPTVGFDDAHQLGEERLRFLDMLENI
jgi:hypothetical protein